METILTPEAKKFIEEWNSPTPYVTARTSGSTGTPKEIRLLKTDMRASAKATINFSASTPDHGSTCPSRRIT